MLPRILNIGMDDIQILNMLQKKGYEVAVALDGNEGIKLYQEAPTDLIIIDSIIQEKERLENIVEFCRDFPEV